MSVRHVLTALSLLSSSHASTMFKFAQFSVSSPPCFLLALESWVLGPPPPSCAADHAHPSSRFGSTPTPREPSHQHSPARFRASGVRRFYWRRPQKCPTAAPGEMRHTPLPFAASPPTRSDRLCNMCSSRIPECTVRLEFRKPGLSQLSQVLPPHKTGRSLTSDDENHQR